MKTTMSRDGSRFVLTVERAVPHPPQRVWRAVTERTLLREWFPCDVVGDWSVGSHLEFRFPPGQWDDLPEEELRGEVTLVDQPRQLEFRWGAHNFRFEIEPRGEGSLFRLSEFFDDASWGARNAAGWEMCIDNLGLILDGAAAIKFLAEVWRTKFDRYVAEFEPDFGPMHDPTGETPLLPGDGPTG